MSDYGIKPEWVKAWREVNLDASRYEGILADFALHLLAGWMESEFTREHLNCIWTCDDRRHTYDHVAWLAAARKTMEEL